tara:strand:+ start:51 stop:248 length:198 start_codon:yes stop_codon:yes gene_type:complete
MVKNNKDHTGKPKSGKKKKSVFWSMDRISKHDQRSTNFTNEFYQKLRTKVKHTEEDLLVKEINKL